jgi:hypothetical protein
MTLSSYLRLVRSFVLRPLAEALKRLVPPRLHSMPPLLSIANEAPHRIHFSNSTALQARDYTMSVRR